MLVESVEPGCLFTKFLLQYENTLRRQKQTNYDFVLKNMNFVSNKELLIFIPFQSVKYRKKELCVDNKAQATIGDVGCPTCRNERCVSISTKKI